MNKFGGATNEVANGEAVSPERTAQPSLAELVAVDPNVSAEYRAYLLLDSFVRSHQ